MATKYLLTILTNVKIVAFLFDFPAIRSKTLSLFFIKVK